MAASTQRGSSNRASSRGRSSSNGSGGSSRAGSATRGRGASAAQSKRGASKTAKGADASAKRGTASAKSTASQAAENGSGSNFSARQAITNVAIPAVTGAIGVAGGVLLGRTALQRNRKVLGIPIPGTKIDMAGVSKQIGEAGRQFGRLASEVQAAREKAEKISKAIS
jgi:hypothetical protein